MSKKAPTVAGVLKRYRNTMLGLDSGLYNDPKRASGGILRAVKGGLVEGMARSLAQIAWRQLGGADEDLTTDKGRVCVPLKSDYLERIGDAEVAAHIKNAMDKYRYCFNIDVPVYIKGRLALAIECKAYAENAMIKRIFFDGSLIRQTHKDAEIILFQLESQLGGDYSQIGRGVRYGSAGTHTLMSYFDYPLRIITLLEGERNIKKPIHNKRHHKEMKKETLEEAVETFKRFLSKAK